MFAPTQPDVTGLSGIDESTERSRGVSRDEQEPAERIAQLHRALLAGRGPGACEQEIAEHTRERPWLGAVPAPVERALVGRQAARLRAGEPIATSRARRQAGRRTRRSAGIGAVTALLARSIIVRLVRSRRSLRR
jgi:hypothetical protein